MNGYKKVFKKYSQGYKSNHYKKNTSINNLNKIDQKIYNQKSLISKTLNGKLEYLKTIEEHKEPINNMISLDNSKYLTSDNNDFYIRSLEENNNKDKDNFGENSKIKKIIYSSEKIIFIVDYFNQNNGKEEKGISHKLNVAINYNNKIELYSCNTSDNPNDILESDNIIITVGKKFIELFQINNNNNSLSKVSEISFNDNEEKYEILSAKYKGKKLISTHGSGHISFWEPINEYPYLKNTSLRRIHLGPINNIILEKNSNNEDILISCSSDKTIKIHSLEETVCFQVINFNEEVIDIKKILNFDGETYYIISLKNGILKLYNASFKEVLEIPNRSNTNNTRYVLNIIKSNINNDNGSKEDYILITEDNKIDVYKWTKKEDNKSNKDSEKINYNKNYYGKKCNYKY